MKRDLLVFTYLVLPGRQVRSVVLNTEAVFLILMNPCQTIKFLILSVGCFFFFSPWN